MLTLMESREGGREIIWGGGKGARGEDVAAEGAGVQGKELDNVAGQETGGGGLARLGFR